ncbi:MAG: hypothetical protein RL755_5 [Pseudomonadota bacterium]|jgi:hypothetical protein
MKINDKLNLVTTVDSDLGTIYIHHTAIGYDVFKENFLALTKVHDAINSEGVALSGARVAYLMLDQTAKESDINIKPLVNELKRLTNVIVPSATGNYEPIAFEVAITDGLIDELQHDEVMNAIVFFTCVLQLQRGKQILKYTLSNMTARWGLLTTSLDCVAYLKQLPILTETDNAGNAAAA